MHIHSGHTITNVFVMQLRNQATGRLFIWSTVRQKVSGGVVMVPKPGSRSQAFANVKSLGVLLIGSTMGLQTPVKYPHLPAAAAIGRSEKYNK